MVTWIDGTVSDPVPASDPQVRAVEKGAIPLAPSFAAFLELLHDAG